MCRLPKVDSLKHLSVCKDYMCRLPKVDSLKHLFVCKDYFSKWSEEKCIKGKSASTIVQFLYEIIYQYGCMKIQINDQGREFVNEISKALNNNQY